MHKAIPHIVIHVASPLVLEAAVLGLSENGSVARAAECIRVEKKTLRAYIRFKGGEVPMGEYKLGLRWRGVLDGAYAVGNEGSRQTPSADRLIHRLSVGLLPVKLTQERRRGHGLLWDHPVRALYVNRERPKWKNRD